MRYRLHLAYDGTNYHGWQRQTSAVGVQTVLEQTLSAVLHQPIILIGCGRTDAGVHASQYYAHFDADLELPPHFHSVMNKALPPDIAIFDVAPVHAQWHARYSATSRTYHYRIHTRKDPMLHRFSTYVDTGGQPLQLEAMQAAAKLFTQYTDYKGLCKTPDKQEGGTRCLVTAADWKLGEAPYTLQFTITANRFLRGMVRLLVAQLLDIGLGKSSVEQLEVLLAQGTRPRFFKLAPPQGLTLAEVEFKDWGSTFCKHGK